MSKSQVKESRYIPFDKKCDIFCHIFFAESIFGTKKYVFLQPVRKKTI